MFQHKLKSSQKDKVRQFINFTQTGEKTALNCLSAHEWKLDVAVDNYFQFPERYNRDQRASVDKKRVEQLFLRYKGYKYIVVIFCVCIIYSLLSQNVIACQAVRYFYACAAVLLITYWQILKKMIKLLQKE